MPTTDILRYLFDEAASGTGPTELIDDTGNGNDLAILYNGNGNFASIAAGSGLQSTQTENTAGGATAFLEDLLNNSTIADHSGENQFSLALVVDIASSNQGSRIFHIGQPHNGAFMYSNGDFSIETRSDGGLTVHFDDDDGAGRAEFPSMGIEGGGLVVLHIVVDCTQATVSNRVKVYKNKVQVAGASNTVRTDGVLSIDANTDISLLDRHPIGGGSPSNVQGTIYHVDFRAGVWTQQEIEDSYDALILNNNADSFSGPALELTEGLTFDNPTFDGFDVQLTTNIDATVDILILPAGTDTQPSEAAFNAAIFGGNSSAGVEFEDSISGYAEATPYKIWARASAPDQDSVYDSLDATTSPDTTDILSVNGDVDLLLNQSDVIIELSQGGTGSSAITINGVAQTGLTVISDTRVSFDFTVWPNALYGSNVQLALTTPDGVVTRNIQFLPPVGSDYIDVAPGYSTSSQVVDASPDLVTDDQIEYDLLDSNNNAVNINELAEVTITGVTPGSFDVRVIDQSDGTRSAAQTINGAAADVTPDQFDLGSDVVESEPAAVLTRSFVLAGVDPGENVSCVAGGDAQVSVNAGSYAASQSAQNGDTINVRVTAGTFDVVRTASLEINGISDSFTVTTRSAVAPTITTQPEGQSVIVNAGYSFSFAANNVLSQQWYDASDDSAISGETGTTLSGTASLADNGIQRYAILTSPEGATVQTQTVTLTVTEQTARITSPVLRDVTTKAIRANISNIPVVVSNLSGQELLTTTVTTNESGVFTIDSNLMGSVGSSVRVSFPQTDSLNTRPSFVATTTAAT